MIFGEAADVLFRLSKYLVALFSNSNFLSNQVWVCFFFLSSQDGTRGDHNTDN